MLLLIRLFVGPNKVYITESTESLQHLYHIHNYQEELLPASSIDYVTSSYLLMKSILVSCQIQIEGEFVQLTVPSPYLSIHYSSQLLLLAHHTEDTDYGDSAPYHTIQGENDF